MDEQLDSLPPSIRPEVSCDMAKQLVKKCFGKSAASVKELKSHQDRNFYIVEEGRSDCYVLKVLMCEENDSIRHELENAMKVMLWLAEQGFVVPHPIAGLNKSHVQYVSSELVLIYIVLCVVHESLKVKSLTNHNDFFSDSLFVYL